MIYLGSSPLKNCFIGSTQVKEIYVGSTLYWSSKKTLSVTLNGNSTAVLKIGGTTAGTYTSSFTYEIPYGSSVTVTVTADTYYYFPEHYNNIKTYTYSSFEEDTNLSLTAEKLSFRLYLSTAMKADVTVGSTTYGGRINVQVAYKTPNSSTESSWLLPGSTFCYSQAVGSYPSVTYQTVYSKGPWECDKDIVFGTQIRPTAGNYATSSSSTTYGPYYYASHVTGEDPAIYSSSYKAPSTAATTASNWFTPGSTSSTSYYLYYVPHYCKYTGRVSYNGYTSNTSGTVSYYLVVKCGSIELYSGKTSNVSTYTNLNISVPSTDGRFPTATFSIMNSSKTSTLKTKNVTLYADSSAGVSLGTI